jgi:hypothetical protein
MTENPIPWRVIRAAPELLETCEFALAMLEKGNPEPELLVLAIQDAIAKATDEPSTKERKDPCS